MRIKGALIAFAVVALMLPSSVEAQFGAGIDFVAEPARGSSAAGGFFQLELEPGDSVKQAVALRNDSGHRLTLRLFATDTSTSLLGGANYSSPEDELAETGTWLTLAKNEVTLKKGASTTVPFEISVPEKAPSGQNLAGIAIYPVREDLSADDVDLEGNEASAQIIVEYRRVIAVLVDLPGNAEPELVISGVTPAARPGGTFLDIQIANQGNGLTKGTGLLEVPDFDYSREFDLDTFVPRSEIFYPMGFSEKVDNGDYRARVRIEYDSGSKVAEWEGTFSVGPAFQEELADRGAPGAFAQPTTRGNLVPYVTALGIVALIYALIKRRRKRARVATPAPQPLTAVAPQEEVVPEPVAPEPVAPEPVVATQATLDLAASKPLKARKVSASPKLPSASQRTTKSTTKTAPARKKSTAKSTPKPVAKMRASASAKTVSTKRATVARATTKKKKVTKKAAAAKKPVAKKKAPAAKKAVARKPVVKKPVAKKKAPAAKKATAKKKTVARKSSAKKAATRKSSTTRSNGSTRSGTTRKARGTKAPTGARSNGSSRTTKTSRQKKTAARAKTSAPKRKTTTARKVTKKKS